MMLTYVVRKSFYSLWASKFVINEIQRLTDFRLRGILQLLV